MGSFRRLAGVGLALAWGVGIHGYVSNGHVWGTRSVPYYVNPVNADVAESAAEAAIRQGADAWSTQSHASFAFSYAGRTTGTTLGANGKNEIFFRNTSNGGVIAETLWTYDGTGKLVDADIAFYDGGWRFFTGTTGCSSGYYIEDVATHEFGHALGLGHSSVSGATMVASGTSCVQELRTLSADDIAGVEALYPPSATTAPASPSGLTAATNAATPASAIDVRWTDNSTNEDSFLVERTTDNVTWLQVARLSSGTTFFSDRSLASATSYTYRVRASNAAGFSGYTNTAQATTSSPTVAPTTLPGTPTALSPANGSTNVSVDADLSWSSAGAQSYDVYYGTASTPALYASNLASPSLALPRMAGGVTYYWKVVAKNSVGSTAGSVGSFQTKAPRGKKK